MKENSIEKEIELLQDETNSLGLFFKCKGMEEYKIALEHILSDYKRVLKENEELKQEKINNYRMIALAQNEALGYMQGYEDGKKIKTSAIASIVENQQYYIIKKQMEKYEEHIAKLQKENEKYKRIAEMNLKNAEEFKDNMCEHRCLLKSENEELKEKIREHTLLISPYYVKQNFIPIQKVKDKIKELEQQDREWTEELSEPDSNFKNIDRNLKRIKNQVAVLQELLEGRK